MSETKESWVYGAQVQDEWWVHAFPITDPTGSVEYGLAFSETAARQFAAAPDLLARWEEALPHLEDYFYHQYGDEPDDMGLLDRVRAAIAKATGADLTTR